jgi:hypothetical protein
MITKAQRDRSYHVLMMALLEERRVMKLSPAVMAQRSKEIYESCYGDDKEEGEDQ